MANEVYSNPWSSALRLSPSRNLFWESEPSRHAERIEYLFGTKNISVSGDYYEGFTHVWKSLLGGRQQLSEVEVVNVLRSTRMTDEALGKAWQEASSAVLLETGPTRRSNTQMVNGLEWRHFIIVLDRCQKINGVDLRSFLGRFTLPPHAIADWDKNPFRPNPTSDSTSQFARSLHSMSSVSGHTQSAVSPYPASPPQSPQSSQPWMDKVLPSSPPKYGNGIENDATGPARARASSYLEDMQDLHIGFHDDGLKDVSTIHDGSAKNPGPTLLHRETESIGSTPMFSGVPGSQEADMIPLLLQKEGFDFSKTKSEPIVPLDHPFFDESSDRSELLIPKTPRSPIVPATLQKELPQSPKTSRRSSLLGRIRSGSGPTSPAHQRNLSLPQISEIEAPRCDSEIMRIAQVRLIDLESSEPTNNPIYGAKSIITRPKKTKSSGQFSLSAFASGLGAAAKEGSLPLVEALFELGADANFSVKGSKPVRHRALDFAAISEHSPIIDYLIRRGADHTAVNNALIHAVLAGKAEIATYLIMKQNADVDAGIFLAQANPDYGSYAHTGHRAHIEYLTVLSAASNITDKKERVQFVKLLLLKGCNVNAYTWMVYKMKEAIKPKGLTKTELETGSHYGTPKLLHDGFGYSSLGRFTPVCATSVELLLQAGAAAAITNNQKPPPEIIDGFKSHGFPCKKYDIIQPISCIKPKDWQSHPAECILVVEALLPFGVNLSCNEPNSFEEKHGWRRAAWGAFEEKWSPSSKSLTPVSRAMAGRSKDGFALLVNSGAKPE